MNGTFLSDTRFAGVQRYAWEVTRRLAVEDDVRVVVPVPLDPAVVPVSRQVVRPPGRISQRFGPWAWVEHELAHTSRGALLWSPTNRAPVRASWHVPTVHDVAALDHPEWFRRSFVELNRFYLPRLVRRARRVISVSEFTKGRLVDLFGASVDQIVVIPSGVDERFRPASPEAVAMVRERYRLPEQFVLAVGTIEPRKNLARLGQAWATLPADVRGATRLVVAGGEGRVFSPSSSGTSSLAANGVRFLGYLDDADLPAVYSAATVFAYPSLYEGFGFPPLEAMACGTPVLSSNITATAEMLGESALLVDPTSLDDIRAGLLQLLSDEALRAAFRARGLAHAHQFSWERSAEATLRTLRAAAQPGQGTTAIRPE